MRTALRIFGGLAAAAIITAGTSAFTAAGIVNNDGPSKFVGGSIAQAVTGGTVESVTYTAAPDTGGITAINLTVTLEDTAAHTVTLTPTGTGSDTFSCDGVQGPGDLTSTCTASGTGYTGLASIDVTIA